MRFLAPEQILQYEDYKNGTEYEDYEISDEGYGFAEREGAETWNGEVNHKANSEGTLHQMSGHILKCLCQEMSNKPYPFICFSSPGEPQRREGPEGRASCFWTGELQLPFIV